MKPLDPSLTAPGLDDCDWLRRLARRLAVDEADAEDAAQSTWLTALERGRQAESPRAWLAAVLRNRLRQIRRSDARRREHETRRHEHEHEAPRYGKAGPRRSADAQGRSSRPHASSRASGSPSSPAAASAPAPHDTPLAPSAAQVAERLELHRRLVAAIDALGEPSRTAIVMRFFDDLPPREIARRQGVPVKTVDTRIARGLKRLRAELDLEYGDRGRWSLALLPLLDLPPRAATVGALGLMVNLKLVVPALLVVCTGAFWFLPERGAREAVPPAEPVAVEAAAAASEPERGGGDLVPVESSARQVLDEASRETPVAEVASEPPPAPVESATLRGFVRDAAGNGVVGIEVGYGAADAPREGRDPSPVATRVSTGSDGSFELAVPTRRAQLDVFDDEWSALVRPSVRGDDIEGVSPVVVVARVRHYAGLVTGPDGEPVEGARLVVLLQRERIASFGVTTLLDRRLAEAESGADGRFELAGVPWCEGLTLRCEASAFDAAELELPPVDSLGLELRLERGAPASTTLTGVVLDEAGRPLADALVSAGVLVARSAGDGRFVLDAARAEEEAEAGARLRVLKPGYLPAERALDSIAEGEELVLVLRVGGLAIRGRLVDTDGRPVEGARVSTFDLTRFGRVPQRFGDEEFLVEATVEVTLAEQSGLGARERHVTSGADGAFELDGLLDKEYELFAIHPRTSAIARATVRAGGGELRLAFAEETAARVAGRVLSLEGQPLTGLQVLPIRTPSGSGHELRNDRGRRVTDDDGAFDIDVLCVEGSRLRLWGPALNRVEEVELDGRGDLASLEVRVPAALRVRVEFGTPPTPGQRLRALDAAGEMLELTVELNEVSIHVQDLPLEGDAPVLVRSDERLRWIAVFDEEGTEVARRAVEARAGELTTVRLP